MKDVTEFQKVRKTFQRAVAAASGTLEHLMPRKFQTVKEFGEYLLKSDGSKGDGTTTADSTSHTTTASAESTGQEEATISTEFAGQSESMKRTVSSKQDEGTKSPDSASHDAKNTEIQSEFSTSGKSANSPDSSTADFSTKSTVSSNQDEDTKGPDSASHDAKNDESQSESSTSGKSANSTDFSTADLSDRKKELQYKLIKSSSKSYHVIIYDPELVEQFDEHEIFCDGTFDVRPKISNCNQVLTILARKYNVVG